MHKNMVIGLAAIGALILTGCSGAGEQAASSQPPPSSAAPTFDVTGAVTIAPEQVYFTGEVGDSCDGHSNQGYQDIHVGGQVKVEDASGTTLAIGAIDDSEILSVLDTTGMVVQCAFKFTVADVPDGQKFYKVELTHRGAVDYSRETLNSAIALTLS